MALKSLIHYRSYVWSADSPGILKNWSEWRRVDYPELTPVPEATERWSFKQFIKEQPINIRNCILFTWHDKYHASGKVIIGLK